jgi:hypothetical protein
MGIYRRSKPEFKDPFQNGYSDIIDQTRSRIQISKGGIPLTKLYCKKIGKIDFGNSKTHYFTYFGGKNNR